MNNKLLILAEAAPLIAIDCPVGFVTGCHWTAIGFGYCHPTGPTKFGCYWTVIVASPTDFVLFLCLYFLNLYMIILLRIRMPAGCL